MITVIMEPDTFEGQPDIVVVCGDVVEEPSLNTLPNNWYIFVREVHAVGDGGTYR
jgi:predicted phosphodiesterase